MNYSEGSSKNHQNPVMIADNMAKILLESEVLATMLRHPVKLRQTGKEAAAVSLRQNPEYH
jgi:hypothetical protein